MKLSVIYDSKTGNTQAAAAARMKSRRLMLMARIIPLSMAAAQAMRHQSIFALRNSTPVSLAG